MDNKVLYEQKGFFNGIRVFKNRIEIKQGGIKKVIPLSNLASIEKMPLMNLVNLLTNDGKKIAVYPKKANEFIDIVNSLLP